MSLISNLSLECYEANILFKFVLEKWFSPDVKISMGNFEYGRSRGGGSLGAREPPFVSHVLSKQTTTGGEIDMKIW